jgi:hypothetical protein
LGLAFLLLVAAKAVSLSLSLSLSLLSCLGLRFACSSCALAQDKMSAMGRLLGLLCLGGLSYLTCAVS